MEWCIQSKTSAIIVSAYDSDTKFIESLIDGLRVRASGSPTSGPSPTGVAPDVQCPGNTIGTMPSYGETARFGDPIALAKRDFRWDAPGDEYIQVGNPQANMAIVMVVRDDVPIARFAYAHNDDGSWTFSGSLECAPSTPT